MAVLSVSKCDLFLVFDFIFVHYFLAGKRVLVFVKTKRMADFLAVWLSEQQMLTTSIHGDRLQCERDLAKWNFKSHHRRILVATAVAVCGVGKCKLTDHNYF